ncbi:MAG TPA: hypothetical protein VMZ52_06885 [Bryobacteraceae bacterium]|nr:hypothetical protein [Bryobacteraceae bacterium]
MAVKWWLFLAGALLSWIVLFTHGAPVIALVAGTGAAALIHWKRK